jgi:hypothetical protein
MFVGFGLCPARLRRAFRQAQGGQACDELFMCPFSSVRRSEQDAALGKGKNMLYNRKKIKENPPRITAWGKDPTLVY